MKTKFLIAISLFFCAEVMGQGYGGPLNVHGLQQQHNHSAASRGFGGVTFGVENTAGTMFLNPASLRTLSGLQVSVAGFRQYRELEQVQNYAPVRYYPNLSLLLEGLTDQIPDPDPDLFPFTPADSVQRPFDDIRPNWTTSRTQTEPLHALVAIPFSLGGITLSAGAGFVEYANLDHFYQHNNVLDPGVLVQRPLPVERPTDDNPLSVNWYQTMRSREGAIRGYGGALAGHIERLNLTIGVSGMALSGSADDFEQRVERGRLTFFANEFRADSSVGGVRRTGTSEFSGSEFRIGSILHGRFVSLGFAISPPSTFTRSFDLEIAADTAGAATSLTSRGEDEFQLPWRGSVSLLITPRERLKIGFEYEFRPYASATLTSANGVESAPWQSSSLFRVGAEYRLASWLALRGGMRGEADVFVPEGSPLVDEAVGYLVYSTGFGLNLRGVRWNFTYENADMNYQDIWASALSNNRDMRHRIITDISITLGRR